MKDTARVLLWGLGLIVALGACHTRQFATLSIYDSPTHFVRLEADPTIDKGHRHTHPVTLAPDEMAAILSGMMIEEPARLLSFLDKSEEPRRHPAFGDAEVRFFAPLLAKALALATPEEVVTFYQSQQETAIIRKVTSGGIFVQGEEMHLILGNYRSPTHYAADPGVADTKDDRLTPMRSIAPQEAKLKFEPARLLAPSSKSRLADLLGPGRREVVVLFRQWSPRHSH